MNPDAIKSPDDLKTSLLGAKIIDVVVTESSYGRGELSIDRFTLDNGMQVDIDASEAYHEPYSFVTLSESGGTQ